MAQSLKNPTTQDFVQKTLGATFLAGANVATLNNVTSIQNLPGVAIVDRVDTNGVETPTKREVITFTGTSGVTVVGVVKNADGSGTDQDHAVGAIVEFGPDVIWAQSVIDGLSQVIVPSTGLVDTTKIVDLTTAQTLTNKIISNSTGSSLTIYNSLLTGDIINNSQINGGTHASLPLFSDQPRLMAGSLTPFTTVADASIMYLDFSLGNKWLSTIVPSGARTFLATNATLGNIGMLRVKFASTASLALGLLNSAASISLVRWAGGDVLPTPTATVGQSDMFGFVCVAANTFDAFIIGQNI